MIKNIINPADHLAEIYQGIEDRCGQGKELSITSLPKLDDKIWGLRRKKLAIVAARPSQGKSAVMAGWAFDFAVKDKTVVYINYEMENEELVERLLARYAEIDNFLLTTGQVSNHQDEYLPKVNEFQNALNDCKLIFAEPKQKTFQEVFKLIEGLGQDVDAVFIDYLQMIKHPKIKDEKQAIDSFLKDFRIYCREKNFSAIVGSQINRGSHDGGKIRPPEMWNIKGSGVIEEHADMIILLHWAWFYTREEGEKNNYWLRVAKNRGGRTGIFSTEQGLRFYPEYYKICEEQHEFNPVTAPNKEWVNEH